MKTVFTTGEAAKICKVSQQTIIRCFDSGQLKGFRVPGSRFRRIPRDQLYSFMRDNGIPTDALDSGKRKILVVDDDENLVELIVDALERDGRFEIRQVNNGFGAGMLVSTLIPASKPERELARMAEPAMRAAGEELRTSGQELVDDLREPARDAAEQLKEHATDAADEVKSTAQSTLPSPPTPGTSGSTPQPF